MIVDDIAVGLMAGATALLVSRVLNRMKPKSLETNTSLTTPTAPVVLAVAKSAAPEQRLRLLVESGALTGDEYAVLMGSSIPEELQGARLSILRGGPNKIQDIKAIRSVFQLGLRDAKSIVDSLPRTFVRPIPYAQAVEIAQRFHSTGMTVVIS